MHSSVQYPGVVNNCSSSSNECSEDCCNVSTIVYIEIAYYHIFICNVIVFKHYFHAIHGMCMSVYCRCHNIIGKQFLGYKISLSIDIEFHCPCYIIILDTSPVLNYQHENIEKTWQCLLVFFRAKIGALRSKRRRVFPTFAGW